MKISFTKKEYRLLLDMLYLGDWVLNANAEDVEKEGHSEHRLLQKKILSHYKEMGAEDIVTYSKEHDDYFETQEYEKTVHEKYLDPYDDETFWDKLMDRLAYRDLTEKLGTETLHSMKGIERMTELDKSGQSYAQEFEVYGLNRLKIQKV